MTVTIKNIFTRTQFILLASLLALVFSFAVTAEAASSKINLMITPADSSIEWQGTNAVTYSFYFDGNTKETKLRSETSTLATVGIKRAIFTLAPGVHTVQVVGTDKKGTVTTSAVTAFNVGTTRPTVGVPADTKNITQNIYPFTAKAISTNEIELEFNCTVPNADHSCKIYQDGNLIKSFDVRAGDYGLYKGYSVKNLTPDTTYKFAIVEFEKKGSLPDRPRVDTYTYTPTLVLKTPSDTSIPEKCGNSNSRRCVTDRTITVLTPNGGEQWDEGVLNTVTWSPYSYDSGSNPRKDVNPARDVTAYLEKKDDGGNFLTIGKVQESGKASIHWITGELNSLTRGGDYALPGDGYYIRVVNNKTDATDRSDKPFTLLPKPIKIKVNGKENWVEVPTVKTPITVSWETTPGVSTCQLSGMKGVSFSTIQPGKGSVTGLMTYEKYKGGVSYGVELQCVKNGNQIRDNARFSVTSIPQEEASLKITSPNGGEKFNPKDTLNINFEHSGLKSYSVALYKNDQWKYWIEKDSALAKNNIQALSWQTPGSMLTALGEGDNAGAIFKIYVTGQRSDGQGYIEDKSDAPFSFVTSPVTCQAIGCTTDKTPPTAPTNVKATINTDLPGTLRISVAWSASTDGGSGVWGYQIKRNDLDRILEVKTSDGNTSFTDYENIKPSTSYTYTIVALDNAKEANKSASVTVTIKTPATPAGKDTVAPSVPPTATVTNLHAVTTKGWTVNVGWSKSTDNVGVTEYVVKQLSSPVTTITTKETQADVSGIILAVENTVSIQAKDAAGNLSSARVVKFKVNFNGMGTAPTIQILSNTPEVKTIQMVSPNPVTVTVPAPVPTPTATRRDTVAPTTPTDFRVTASTTSSITLGWSASTDESGIQGYNIYRGSALMPQNGTPITGLTYTDSGLTQGTSYMYTIEAIDKTTNKSTKATVSGKTAVTPVVTNVVVPTLTLTASPSTVVLHQPSTITWKSTNATACIGSEYDAGFPQTKGVGESVAPTGSLTQTFNESKSYDFTCTGPGGSVTKTVTVSMGVLPPAPTCKLSANKSSYILGETITYSWTSTNATGAGWVPGRDASSEGHVTLPGANLGVNGTQAVVASAVGNPDVNLAVTGGGGTGMCSLTVAVTSPAPVVTIDKTVPSVPASATVANVTTVAGAGWSAVLSWGESTDNVGVTGYIVKSIAPTAGALTTTTGKSFTLTNLSLSTPILLTDYSVSIQAKDARGNLGPARVVKFRLNFAGMGAVPTVQIVSNTVDTTAQKVVAQAPTKVPLTSAGSTSNIATFTTLMNKLIELKGMVAALKASQKK